MDDPRVGAIFLDRLKVLHHIGGGGMGAVYEVEHLRTGHRRALKIVRPEYSAQPRYMQRLLREAKVAATLNTPHVAETLDAGVLEDGSAYVLMELLNGRPLIALLEERPKLEPEEVVWIASEICQGLDVAHAAGIVHRDLKPENIFLVPSGDEGALVKILDFGISQFPASLAEAPDRLTREGTILGTPFYMSPEQAAGRTMDSRTDIYALGVVMYEALSGSLPFDSPTIGELFMRIAAGEYMPLERRTPELDPNLVAVVARAMHRVPDERFASAAELQQALTPFLGRGPAAPGRVTLRLNALAQPPKERVATLDYAAAPASERETMAPPDSQPPGQDLAHTPSSPVAAISSSDPSWATMLEEPAAESSPPAARDDAVENDNAIENDDAAKNDYGVNVPPSALASTPPAGMPSAATPSSIPPPPSIAAALATPPPEPSAAPMWRSPLVLAASLAVVAFALSMWWRTGSSGQRENDTRPAASGEHASQTPTIPPEADMAPRTPAVPGELPAANVARAPDEATGPDAGASAPPPPPHVTRPHVETPDVRPNVQSHQVKHRPSQAAGLDQNPY